VIPSSMRAIRIRTPGGPEVLEPVALPTPVPGQHHVLIAVAAAGVNRPDVMQRQGQYPPPPGAPDTPGLEVAGTVVAVGPQVDGLGVGDRVCALVAGGGYAAFCAAPAPQVLPIPAGLTPIEAAALPETFFTVWSNLFDQAGLCAGEWLLVHGGASGIGTTAIQLARAFGAQVIATAGSPDKCAACLRLGATRAVNYREEDFVAAVREATGGAGVNVVLDMVGGDYVARNLECLAREGRHQSIAFQRGHKATFSLLPVLHKRLRLSGSGLRPRPIPEKAAIAAALRERVWPLLEAGTVRPVIDSTFPLEQAGAAHARLESGAHIGKIVLTV
jgi:NADPH:quinone reductase